MLQIIRTTATRPLMGSRGFRLGKQRSFRKLLHKGSSLETLLIWSKCQQLRYFLLRLAHSGKPRVHRSHGSCDGLLDPARRLELLRTVHRELHTSMDQLRPRWMQTHA